MTDQQHPITPSPELVMEWVNNHYGGKVHRNLGGGELSIAAQAAQWGADQELEACCEWLPSDLTIDGQDLRSVRRPKPPSLKEQALEALQFVDEKLDLPLHNHCNAIHTIRRALEALPND
jgi:hypothetical protein